MAGCAANCSRRGVATARAGGRRRALPPAAGAPPRRMFGLVHDDDAAEHQADGNHEEQEQRHRRGHELRGVGVGRWGWGVSRQRDGGGRRREREHAARPRRVIFQASRCKARPRHASRWGAHLPALLCASCSTQGWRGRWRVVSLSWEARLERRARRQAPIAALQAPPERSSSSARLTLDGGAIGVGAGSGGGGGGGGIQQAADVRDGLVVTTGEPQAASAPWLPSCRHARCRKHRRQERQKEELEEAHGWKRYVAPLLKATRKVVGGKGTGRRRRGQQAATKKVRVLVRRKRLG